MKINHRNTNLTKKKLIKGFRLYAAIVLCFALFGSVTAFAAGDPLSTINNLSTFIFGLIRAVGLIVLGWGIVQVGLSFQSHDPSQRSNGFLQALGQVAEVATEEPEPREAAMESRPKRAGSRSQFWP